MRNIVTEGGALQSLKLYKLQRCFSLADDVLDVAISALEEVQQLHAIGTVSEFRELKEKATAKKPFGEPSGWTCPNCGEFHSEKQSHCSECNQTILWT